MAHTRVFEQIMTQLANGQVQEANELFHNFVVQTSKEIYENAVEGEEDDELDDFDTEDDLDTDEEDEGDDDLAADEETDDLDMDDEEGDMIGGDETDDLEADLTDDDDEESDEDTEDLFQDLEDIVDQLQSKFDSLNTGNTADDDETEEDELKDSFSFSQVREYVERVSDGHGAEKKGRSESPDNKRSVIDNMKNDMGGTNANILSSKTDDRGNEWGTAGGQLKGNGLTKNVQQMNTGNINVPGGKAGKTGFKNRVAAGHGAEKKGASEGKTEGTSLFRGRR